MIVGKIIGKVTTKQFQFLVEQPVKKFDFLQVYHRHYDRYILAQINEIERTTDGTIAHCSVIGFRDEEGRMKQIRVPFDLHAEVMLAHKDFIKQIFQQGNHGAYVGMLEGKQIKIFLDLNKLLTKHVAVLAKSGAGKSYTVGVLLEEILEKGIPLLIIDPHGEYGSLRWPNEQDKARMHLFDITPKSYAHQIKEYGNPSFLQEGYPLKVKDNFTSMDLEHILPTKLSQAQQALLFAVARQLDVLALPDLIYHLEAEESNLKWSLINALEYLQQLGYFSSQVDYKEMIQPGQATIINLRGIAPEIQEVIVYKLLKDLFELRKRNQLPPFFTVIEEAHNFCPERSYGEKKSSAIIRTIAAEGRKFGMGLCVISQRPARVEKSVLSQCTTQIIMNVTNPNDLKAILGAVEGLTAESYEEIKNLPVGTALIAGVVDMPLVVAIRPRRTKHGGETVSMFAEDYGKREQGGIGGSGPLENQQRASQSIPQAVVSSSEIAQQREVTQAPSETQTTPQYEILSSEPSPEQEQKKEQFLPLVYPDVSKEEWQLMHGVEQAKTVLLPVQRLLCYDQEGGFTLLLNLHQPGILLNVIDFQTGVIPPFEKLSKESLGLLKQLWLKYKEPFAVPLELMEKPAFFALLEQGFLKEDPATKKAFFNPSYIFSKLRKYHLPKQFNYQAIEAEQLPKASEEAITAIKAKIQKHCSIDQEENGWLVMWVKG